MTNLDNPGSIPKGHTGACELLERTVAEMYGSDAVARIQKVELFSDEVIEFEDGSRPRGVRAEITRAGRVISKQKDDSQWKYAQDAIISALVIGTLKAFVEHPVTKQPYRIMAEHWREEVSSLAFQYGTYKCASDSALRDQVIFFEDQECEAFLSKESLTQGSPLSEPPKLVVEQMPKANPPLKVIEAWVESIATEYRIKDERISKESFKARFLEQFPRALVNFAKEQYRLLPDDVKNPNHRPRKS